MDDFSLEGGPSVVNTGSMTPQVTIDPLTGELYTIITGATISNKLIIGTPSTYPTNLGTSYIFPEEMGTDGQTLVLNETENKLIWATGVSSGITNGGQVGPVVVGSTDNNLTLIAAGDINIGNGPSNRILLNGGLTKLHTVDNSAGPTIDLTTDKYSVSYTNTGVTTVRLPAANSNVGREYFITHNHTGAAITLTVAPASGDLIDGIASIPLQTQGSHIRVISIGSNAWKIV